MLELAVGDNIHLSDISFPEGVTSVSLSHGGDDADLVVASVHAAKGGMEEEEEAAAEPEEGEAPAAGESEEESDED